MAESSEERQIKDGLGVSEPDRSPPTSHAEQGLFPAPNSKDPSHVPSYPPPPRRTPQPSEADWEPLHYSRDPHKLIAYLVPYPKPALIGVSPDTIPHRFFVYTPPPPPLSKPSDGQKEPKLHKLQRKWQEEKREANASTAKAVSWKGFKSKATRGIDWAMQRTTSSNLDFINRLDGEKVATETQANAGISSAESSKPKKVELSEMVLMYPSSLSGSPESVREEFVHSLLRTKSKAQRDAVIATGLLPFAFAIDVLATVIWPFGGLLEIDGVWAYSSIRGAKIARSATKRLAPGGNGATQSHGDVDEGDEDDRLHLSFVPSSRLDVLQHYLAYRCHEHDGKLFPSLSMSPTETEVLEAMGWVSSESSTEERRLDIAGIKDDLQSTMRKAAREWTKWCKAFAKNPKKAMKK